MKHLKFKPGEFITQASVNNGSFAVFDGEVFEPTEKGGPYEYSLMCFYNPEHYTQDSEGKYKKEYVFECDLDDDTCEYILDDTDMAFWRTCTEQEKRDALKFLAEVKHIAFDEKTLSFRKLKESEKISFEAPKPTGFPGGNVNPAARGINPFYGRGAHGPGSVGNNPVVKRTKTITLAVKDNWEQKEPMCNMTDEHIEFVSEQCEKLKYAFDTYSTNVMRYPTNGREIPIRGGNYAYDACGWPIGSMANMLGGCCDYYDDF